jgi:NADPH2:quinone reductase
MARVVRIHDTGGPEVLTYENRPVGEPGPGEVRLRQTAIGLNYIDTYHRSGLYPLPELPAVLGREAAGVVEAVGPGVSEFHEGDRVAYAMSAGAYASERTIDVREIVRLPEGIDERRAAAMMLKGLTAHYLLRRTYRVKQGDTILVHAAAGGVGLILCQWAKKLGATVIGTVGNEEKAELARSHGCDHPVVYTAEDFLERVRAITDGRGVPVVYDSVGRATFDKSLDCLEPLGLMVSFGQASGPVPPFAIGTLAAKGSLFLTRPTLATYIARREELVAAADELFRAVVEGSVRIEVRQTFPLSEVERAHRHLESRRTSGSTVLIP